MSGAQTRAAELSDELLALQSSIAELRDDPDTWHGRARLTVDWLEQLDSITRNARELRRAYGHELDEATLNRLDLNMDTTRTQVVALLRLTIDETSKEVAR